MIINGEFLIKKLCACFTSIGVDIIPSLGEDPDYAIIQDHLSTKNFVRYAKFVFDNDDLLHQSSEDFYFGWLHPIVYATTHEYALTGLIDFLTPLLGENLSRRLAWPYTLGAGENEIIFEGWNPLEYPTQATKTETFYYAMTNVEVRFRFPCD